MHLGSLYTASVIGAILLSSAAIAQQIFPLEDVVKAAASRSTLAAPGGAPFHLRAMISRREET